MTAAGLALAGVLNKLAGTSGLDAAGAANAWAGTSNLDILGALNTKAGLARADWLGLSGVCDYLAGTVGLEAQGALQTLADTDLFVDSATGNDTTGAGTLTAPYATVAKAVSVATGGQKVALKAGSVFRPAAALAPTIPLSFSKYGSGASPIISGGSLVTSWVRQSTSPFVQRFTSKSPAAGTALSVAIDANTTTGNFAVLAIKTSGGVAISSITDSKGNTWAVDKASSNVSGARAHVASARLTTALTTTDTITINVASSASAAVAGYEYQNITASTPADVSAESSGSGTTASAGPTGVTAQANEVALSVVGAGSSIVGLTPPAGYTERASAQTANAVDLAEKVLTSTGTQTAAWTIPSATWASTLVTYKLASSSLTNIYAATLASTPAFVTVTSSGVTTGASKGASATSLNANEWFYSSGQLYLNLGGTDPSTVTVEAAVRQVFAVTSAGFSGSSFQDIEFRHGFDRMVRISNATNLTFSRCTFRYAGYISNSGTLSLDGGGAGSVRVLGCTFDKLMNDGIWWATTTGGVEVANCTFTNIGYLANDTQSDAIQVYTGFGVTGSFSIHDNYIDVTGMTGPKGCIAGPEGAAGASVNGSVIERNTLIGGAYAWGGNGSDLTFRYNVVKNQTTGGGGIQVDATGGTTTNLRIYRNLLVNCGAAGLYVASGGPALVGFVLANNTVIDCHGVAMNIQPASIDSTSIVKNNLVASPTVTATGYVKAWPTSGGLPSGWDNNLYPADAANAYQYKGTNYSTLAAFVAAISTGTHSLATATPNLSGDGNYTPLVGSPAINAGSAVSGVTDGYLGSAPDIGYVEVS